MRRYFQSLWARPSAEHVDPALSAQVTAQAIDFLYRNLPGVIISITLMPVMMVLVMWRHVDRSILLVWCAAALLVTATRLVLNRAYHRASPPVLDAPRWGRKYTFTALISGLVWGAAGVLFFIPDAPAQQVFLFTSIVGLCAGSIILNSYWIASYYAFALPALLLSSLRMFAEGELAYSGLGALTLMLGVVLLQVAQSTRRSALAAIQLRFENLDLVERLRSEMENAANSNRDKTRFLAAASHDLRQPVHALSLFAEALRKEQASERGQLLLADMGQSIQALNQLLESLIDISKLDAGVVKPALAHFVPSAMLDRLRNEYNPQAQAKGLILQIASDCPALYSDPILLEAIVRNLISNAIRYTQAGRVAVSCRRDDQQVCIEVHDTGIGIPHDHHKAIFREFFQLGNPERDRSKGLGLGLAIVERLGALLGHRIEVDSTPGQGSCFSLWVPIGVQAQVATQQIEATQYAENDVAGLRILVLDDEVAIRKGMCAVLADWGCVTWVAGSEEEALTLIDRHAPPQVIIADYRLRDNRTGVQAIDALRTAAGSEIPALIITGDTSPERLREIQASGHALMYKPVQPGKLRAYLRRMRRAIKH